MRNKALFLDRDGVINQDYDYVHKQDNFDFIPGIFDLVADAKAKGYKIFVITNQAGIGRGLYNEEQFHELMNWVRKQLDFDKVYFCPHHPEYGQGSYKQDCFDRKPNPGMIFKAKEEYNIDLSASVMIGDRESDMQAAKNAGIATKILFNPANSQVKTVADAVITKLKEAEDFL